MMHISRNAYRQALSEFVGKHFAEFHITVELPPGSSRSELEHHVREFYIRLNRVFLGRNWFKSENAQARMQGIVSFEEGAGGSHAHMLVKPPAGVDPKQFAEAASHVWTRHLDEVLTIYRGRPVTGRAGKIHIQTVTDTSSDRWRVARYDLKRVTHTSGDGLSWKFIDQLTALRRGR